MNEERHALLEIQHAPLLVPFLRPLGQYWIAAFLYFAPWRSLLLGMLLLIGAALLPPLTSPLPALATWVSFFALVILELRNRRAFLSSDALVLEAGLFHASTKSYPVAQVRDVSARSELLGKLVDVGDIEVFGDGWAVSLMAVRHPSQVARAILRANRATLSNEAGGRTSG